MTSIIVYKPKFESRDSDAVRAKKRRDGMLEAGDDLRSKLAKKKTDEDVKKAVNKVVRNIVKGGTAQALLEVNSSVTPDRYEITERKGGKFKLENIADPTDDKRKLKLKGAIDDFEDESNEEKKRRYRMTVVSPYDADHVKAWRYLADTVHADLQEIQKLIDKNPPEATKEDIENYLIATFAFTRCR